MEITYIFHSPGFIIRIFYPIIIQVFGYLGKGKAPNSIHTQDASLAPNGINPKDSLAPKGIHNLKLPLPFRCLTDNRKGAKLRAVSCNLISLASKILKTKILLYL